MMLKKLYEAKLIHPPKWLIDNVMYLTQMGSAAYGVSSDDSDLDIYGFCIPPKDMVFPHLAGEIPGFGNQIQRFDQYQQHHIKDPNKKIEYDFTIFGIVKYFSLCMENNPNALDSLFTPRRCVIHSTLISEHVRTNRKLFLHKGSYYRFRGYAYSQLSKIRNKINSSNPKRAATIASVGYDTKFAYHICRLALEAEQILMTYDLDLERDRELLKSVRRGEWTFDRLEQWFTDKESFLEELYSKSDLRSHPDEPAIKKLLLECLEQHYGDLSSAIKRDVNVEGLVRDMRALLDRYDVG